MGKKYVNTGTSDISFGNDVKVLKGETIELSEELLKEKADAVETLIGEGKLTEAGKVKEKPKEPVKPEEKPQDKKK